MKIRIFKILFFLVLVGCGAVVKKIVDPPKVKVKDVKISEVSSVIASGFSPQSELDLDVYVDIENPNNFSVKADQVDYNIFIKNELFLAGKVEGPIEVDAKNTKSMKIPLKIPLGKLVNSVLELFSGKPVEYKVQGSVKVGILDIPFEKLDQFTFSRQ